MIRCQRHNQRGEAAMPRHQRDCQTSGVSGRPRRQRYHRSTSRTPTPEALQRCGQNQPGWTSSWTSWGDQSEVPCECEIKFKNNNNRVKHCRPVGRWWLSSLWGSFAPYVLMHITIAALPLARLCRFSISLQRCIGSSLQPCHWSDVIALVPVYSLPTGQTLLHWF